VSGDTTGARSARPSCGCARATPLSAQCAGRGPTGSNSRGL
jgi:hypothetical protein